MSLSISISDAAATRALTEDDLPLNVGSGPSADIRIPGAASDASVALISLLDGRPIVQPAAAGILTLNGDQLAGTRWLEDGDVLAAPGLTISCSLDGARLHLQLGYQDLEYKTAPPELVEDDTGSEPEISAVRMRSARDRTQPVARRGRVLIASGGAALLLLLASALYIFTARSISFTVMPDTAEVEVSGALLTPRIGGRYLLQGGDYQVTFKAPGYVDLEEQISVGAAASQEFEFRMREQPGRITVTTGEDRAADVFVDGELVGRSPAVGIELDAGTYEVKLVADRYLDFVTMLEVEGRGREQTLEAQLVPGWADVGVGTSPPGATVLVEDEELGVTPVTVPVLAGVREIVIRKDGYRTVRSMITAVANQPEQLPLIELQEAAGVLELISRPAGAAVTVNGRFSGNAPLELELVKDQSYDIRLSKAGYDTVSRTVTAGPARTLRFELKARRGVIKIISNPPDASLLVDGELIGNANREIELLAVPHRLEVRKEGFESFVKEVTPKPGLPQQIEVSLLTPQQAVLAATPKSVTTGQGLILRLVGPGEFMMGAARREQGRRANETRRNVKLTGQYYLGVREITNREFREFMPRHTSGAEKYRELAADNHPVVMVSWDMAVAYCNWLSVQDGLEPAYIQAPNGLELAQPPTNGYRLPTEAEWVWAARYSGGGGSSKYPWGDRMPPSPGAGNFADSSARGFAGDVLASYDDGFPVTSPVEKFAPNPLGLFDTGGNVAEWVNDFYAVSSQGGGVEIDPFGPPEGQYHVIRGSSWRQSSISELRYAYRDFGDKGRLDVGFRIARSGDSILEQ